MLRYKRYEKGWVESKFGGLKIVDFKRISLY
jgi:hypothetical protein